MTTKAKLILIWLFAFVMLAIGLIYLRSQDEARKVESFLDHSEIPNYQNFEQHIHNKYESIRDLFQP
jgi:hypothetical protein